MKTDTYLLQFRHRLSFITTIIVLPLLLAVQVAAGAIIWNGPTITFTQPGTDATQTTNQDRLTPNVWLTRANVQGLFNA